MNLVTPVVVASAMFLVAGCIGPDMPRADNDEDEEAPVVKRDLAQGPNSGHEEADRLVIASQEEWASFWHKHDEKNIPGSDPPQVDFDSERVVAVLMGERNNGCYHVEISDVRLSVASDETRVNVTQYVPGPDAVCTDQMVYPYHFVAVPADGTEVVFEEHEAETP